MEPIRNPLEERILKLKETRVWEHHHDPFSHYLTVEDLDKLLFLIQYMQEEIRMLEGRVEDLMKCEK